MANRLTSSGWLIAIALLTVLSQFATFYLIPDGQFNDDAAYALRALKFADPVGQRDAVDVSGFRPGWPVALAVPLALSGNDLRTGRVLSIACTAASAVLLAQIFAQLAGSRVLACLLVLLFTQQKLVLQLGSSLMSEPFYIFLILCSFSSTRRMWSGPAYLFWGILAGWCTVVRPEGLVVAGSIVFCLAADKKLNKKNLGIWIVGFLAFRGVFGLLVPYQRVHMRVLSTWAEGDGYNVGYLWKFFKLNSFHSLSAITGGTHPVQSWFWPVLALGICGLFYLYRGRIDWRALATEPMMWWVVLYPGVLTLWPYFDSRYWILWSIVALGLIVSKLPPRVAWIIPVLLLVAQFPQSLTQYRNGPVARKFQNEVYLPYYREFSQLGTVMSLNYARIELLSDAATKLPMERSEFISIPLGMAGMGVEYVEWEGGNRHIRTLYGEEAVVFPPRAYLWLKASTLFEVHHTCGFSTCFRLKADPRNLVQAARLIATARAEQDPSQKLELYNQALELVLDLPEARIERALHQLTLDPRAEAPVEELMDVYRQYPHNYDHGENLLELLRFRGNSEGVNEIATLAVATVEKLGGTPRERFAKYLSPAPRP